MHWRRPSIERFWRELRHIQILQSPTHFPFQSIHSLDEVNLRQRLLSVLPNRGKKKFLI